MRDLNPRYLLPKQGRYQATLIGVILYLSGCERLESNQLPSAYETDEMPFLYAAIYLVDRRGFEPRTLECKSSAFPITPSAQIFINTLFILLHSVCYGEFFGAPGETRTRKIRLLRPACIPIPSPGQYIILEHPPGNRTGYCDLEGRYVSAYTTDA
jgi:hypothetical protein